MNLRREIAQLVVVRASGYSCDSQRRYPRWELTNQELENCLSEGVGGVILLGGSTADLALRCRQLQQWAGTKAENQLLLCADVEEGVGQRFEGATWLVPPLALAPLWQDQPHRAEALAKAYGQCTGREAQILGLNWVLGPVCDVNNNPANPVINVRAWGETVEAATALSKAFLQGLEEQGVLGCAKHFPGHGDTSQDSHLQLPCLNHSVERLENLELLPFKAAIKANVASVMTAHLQLPALDPNLPATLSGKVLTGLLRQQLGFDGLIVTDALVMEAITSHYGAGEAAALAFDAGADLILMPADFHAALTAIEQGFKQNRWPRERLEQSLKRRRLALARCAVLKTDATAALAAMANCALNHGALAQELLQVSLQQQGCKPNQQTKSGLNLIRVDNSLACSALPPAAPALLRPQAAGLQTILIDGSSQPLNLERLPAGGVLLQLFVRGNPFRGTADADGYWAKLVQNLVKQQRLKGLVVYGSPYLWQELKDLIPAHIAAVYSPGQMPAAQVLALESLGFCGAPHEGGFTN